ncbi:MAG TPA: PKD domain-containing protein, partial [Paenibacillus sp.]
DALTYVWTITRPDGSTLVRTTTNVALTDVQQGVYDVRLRATDPSGASHERSRTFFVGDLRIVGEVHHTPEWEQYRQSWNARFPLKQRAADTFWAGEALLLRATVTDTGASATKPTDVTATLLETGTAATLSGDDLIRYDGEMANADFATTLADGMYTMRFRVTYTNGRVETYDVPFRIAGSLYDVIVQQQRL